ncbi:short-chain dehydrogenase/reductase SDR [Duffyella gerundensis]|uniref:Short-chain dehydrogenase/reductase SDR n=1 Tax=Duffyella gerundensis TaxID=1619313 RepID=A0A0U5L6D0_9GAMM|nr:SDR family NAD(P)-dependent oxidoreductase [Duffyella gerundensis]CUU24023.1 short-chain dehydrogenase/reductase SDR [Duffyella gerundensis]
MKSTGNTFLITGGGTGIGLALAQRWHDMGNHVIITGRRQQVLQDAVAGRERMTAYALDVTAPDAVDRFVQQVIADHPDINILVNNAGIFSAEKVTTRRDISDAERMIETNIVGPMRLTNAMIDHLSGQPNAALINVSSGLAFVPFPAAPTYSATKAALHAWTAAIRPLLKDKVEVIEIVPPQVQTELTPGQSQDANSMPLDAFADEVIALLHATPTPAEVCVERVRYFREAEAKGQFDEALQMLAQYS